MKLLNLTSLCIIFLGVQNLNSQELNIKENNIQFDIGISNTLHHTVPVNLRLCIEGCLVEAQEERMALNVGVNFYRKMDSHNSFKIGVGIAEYNFFEKGLSAAGFGVLELAYERTHKSKYFILPVGIKHNIGIGNNSIFYIETEFILELARDKAFFVKQYGIATKFQVGTNLKLSDKLNMNVSAFFKTGIMDYSRGKFENSYIPYGYGLQLGINRKI